jgi:hypothetical protein
LSLPRLRVNNWRINAESSAIPFAQNDFASSRYPVLNPCF